ncbi:MAG: nicotinate-nucleotide--dimethylbenzimidazole phosphoribosyltransferase [Coriobacteriia bacterium]
MQTLDETRCSIADIDPAAMDAAQVRLDSLTKPPGSLGRLEELAARIAAIQGTARPALDRKRVIVMAGDHGVVAQGVSPYPQEVTAQMVANFAAGGAAINQIAAWAGADVVVVDVGVAADVSGIEGIVHAKIRPGTDDMSQGPAMSRAEAIAAMEVGLGLANEAHAAGVDIVAIGEMGIGNTTAAAAVTAALTGERPEVVVGPGTGLDPEGVARKARIVARALEVNDVDPEDPLGVVSCVGGLEIAGLAGVVVGCAAHGIPVVADGFISGAAALVASRYEPRAEQYLFLSHVSAEPGHLAVTGAFTTDPVLDLQMRLGEGTGAALAMGIIDAACRCMSDMATFEEAGVSDRE